MIRQITIILIPLLKGENMSVSNETIKYKNKKWVTIDIKCDISDTTTFNDLITEVIEHKDIISYLKHLLYVKKAITVHFNYWDNCSHGPYNLLEMKQYLEKKVKPDKETSEYCYSRNFQNKFYILYPTDVTAPFVPKINIDSKTPIVWLDVDGVVNIFRKQRRTSDVDDNCADVKEVSILHGYGFALMNRISYFPSIIERINRWSEVAEVRFMTSWSDLATYRLAPSVGLFPFAHNEIGKYELTNKMPSEEDLERPIVWIDDDINNEYTEISKSCKKLKSHFKNKVLIVDTSDNENKNYVGLTEKQADVVDEFLNLKICI